MDMPTYYWPWPAFVGWRMMYCFLKGGCPEINPTLQEHGTISIQDTAHPPCHLFVYSKSVLKIITQTRKESELSHSKITCGMNIVLPSSFTWVNSPSNSWQSLTFSSSLAIFIKRFCHYSSNFRLYPAMRQQWALRFLPY